MGGQAAFLVASGYCGCGQKTLVIVFVTLGIGVSGFAYAGYVVNYLDIAGQYAGSLIGIGNTLSCIAGIVGPILVGCITHAVIIFYFTYQYLTVPVWVNVFIP